MGEITNIDKNPVVTDGYIQPKFTNDGLEVEEDYIFDVINKKVNSVHDLIKESSGDRLFQAYLYGMSKELGYSMDRILSLFLDPEEPDRVYNKYFDEMVYESDKLRLYEWELKQFMKKAGCDRDLYFNEFKNLYNGESLHHRYPCGSDFCPDCNNKEVLKRKRNLVKYVMNVPHVHYTFTANRSVWKSVGWDNIGEYYQAVGEAVKTAYKEVYGVEVGIIINTHTYSSLTLEWQPHADVFVSMKGLDGDGNIKNATINRMKPKKQKGVDKKLLRKIRSVYTKEIYGRFNNIVAPDTEDKLFWVRQNMNKDGEIVAKPLIDLVNIDTGEVEGGLLGDTLRYFKRLPITNENIIDVCEDRIIFTTDKRIEESKAPIQLNPHDFYLRVSQHVKPRNFRGMRLYGVYSYNHKYHHKAKKEHGYGFNSLDIDLKRGGFKEISKEIYKVVDEMGTDIDPTDLEIDDNNISQGYLTKMGYIVVQVEKRLTNKGVLSEGHHDRLLRCVRSLIDYSCKGHDYNTNTREGKEKPVLSAGELYNLMSCKDGKEVEDQYGKEAYQIYDKVIKKVVSGLADPVVNEDKETFMWVGFSCYGDLVSYSLVGSAIFNTHDFKEDCYSLRSLIVESNNYFAGLKDPPDVKKRKKEVIN